MTGSRILIKSDEKNRSTLDPNPESGWYLLGGIGLVFSVVALADLVLAWYPLQFGDAEWEFGTATTVLGGMPLLAMGLGLSFGSAVARGKLGAVRLFAVGFGLLALLLIGVLALYAGTITTALATIQPALKAGLQKAIIKTVAQGVLYPAAFLWIAITGWKHARTGVTP
ncbi:MAG: hypothetical protein IPI38_14825 [Gemmatimonadetes bacterium]|nr:hypothetical protein [Gemmatimonadota bacterium]MBK6781308.1 hypothetical protein [Gemmatimonadota bacterium]MBK7349734.1 hypothetical protein [Gemmatimonadota bacterium]MBK7716679.1 hypothetical protein [Gemmatimonadota bacterium]MBK7784365.1 hypothetical protein [Gemmatimonadota bacterium]